MYKVFFGANATQPKGFLDESIVDIDIGTHRITPCTQFVYGVYVLHMRAPVKLDRIMNARPETTLNATPVAEFFLEGALRPLTPIVPLVSLRAFHDLIFIV